jgi:hypothetical protein
VCSIKPASFDSKRSASDMVLAFGREERRAPVLRSLATPETAARNGNFRVKAFLSRYDCTVKNML